MANEINGYYNFKTHIKKRKKQDFKIICLIYKINKPQTNKKNFIKSMQDTSKTYFKKIKTLD